MTSIVAQWALTYLLHSTILIGIALLVSRRIHSAQRRDFLWKIAIIGGVVTASLQLAVPPRLHVALPGTEKPLTAPAPGAAITESRLDARNSVMAAPTKSRLDSELPPSSGDGSRSAAAPFRWPSKESLLVMVLSVWLGGAAIFAGRLLLAHVRLLKRLGRRRDILNGEDFELLERLRQSAAVHSPVRLTTSSRVHSPIAMLGSEIVVPRKVFNRLDPTQRASVLAHELEHVRRRDPQWLTFSEIICALLFFQPLNRLAIRRFKETAEFICDDAAIERVGDRKALAQTLATIASVVAPRVMRLPAMAESGSGLVRRISRMLRENGVPDKPLRAIVKVPVTIISFAAIASVGFGIAPESAVAQRTEPIEREELDDVQVADLSLRVGADDAEREVDGSNLEIDSALDSDFDAVVDPALVASESDRGSSQEAEIERAIERKMFGITEEYRSQIAAAGYDLSHERLVEFRIHGVTPQYIAALNGAGFGRLSAEKLVEARVHGVTPGFIDEMRATFGSLPLQKMLEMKIHDVSPRFAREMESAGFDDLSTEELLSFRIHGVTSDYIRTMSAAGFGALPARRILELRIHGVTPATIAGAQRMFPGVDLDDVVSLQIHGVTRSFVDEMRTRGYVLTEPDKAVEARIHSVTPAFIDALKTLGYDDVPLDELVRLRVHGVSASHIERLRDEGFTDLTLDQIVRLRIAGIDPSELRSPDL